MEQNTSSFLEQFRGMLICRAAHFQYYTFSIEIALPVGYRLEQALLTGGYREIEPFCPYVISEGTVISIYLHQEGVQRRTVASLHFLVYSNDVWEPTVHTQGEEEYRKNHPRLPLMVYKPEEVSMLRETQKHSSIGKANG